MIVRLLIFLTLLPCLLRAETIFFNDSDFSAGYYYVPEGLTSDSAKLWVMVDVHGTGGIQRAERRSWLTKLVAPTPVIVMVPAFTNGYQTGEGEWAAQLIENFKSIQAKHSVHDRMFVHGFSGGGQFAHRFAMNHPEYVVACSAHSSGTWACAGGYGEISEKAKSVPFFISCGEKDQGYAGSGFPHTRIEWYHLFAKELEKEGFTFLGKAWPRVGHEVPRDQPPLVAELFHFATMGTLPKSEGWVGLPGGSQPGVAANSKLSELDKQRLRSATKAITSGNSPDVAATLKFLVKHPASTWVNEAEFAPLADHCRKVIGSYLEERKSSGSPITGAALDRFRIATKGLMPN